LTEIAQAHPEAEPFEIWSQDEARVGQKGRTGYVWWQRGDTHAGCAMSATSRLGSSALYARHATPVSPW
jgi:hypothetical protein